MMIGRKEKGRRGRKGEKRELKEQESGIRK